MPNWFSRLLGRAKETTGDSAGMDQIKSEATEAASPLGQHSPEGEGAAAPVDTALRDRGADVSHAHTEEATAEGEGAAGTASADTTPRPETGGSGDEA